MEFLRTPLRRTVGQPPLWLIFTFVISGTLSLHVFVPALPAAARELGVSAGTIQLTLTVYVLGLAVGQLVYGPLSDRFGRRPMLLAGLLLYAAGGIAAGLAPDVGTLIVARVLQALGGCSGLVLGRAVIRDVSAPHEAAARLAWLNMFMSMAPAGASVVGGLLSAWLSWRLIFAMLALIGLATLAAALFTLPETNAGVGRRPGGLLRSYGRLLGMPAFRVYALAGACATTSFYGFLAAAPFIFGDMLQVRPALIGLCFVMPMLGYALGSLGANRLARRLPTARLLHLGFAVTTLGAGLFFASVVTGHLSVAATLGSVLLFTAGGGLVSPIALTAALGVLPGAIGAASGLYGCGQMAFGALCTLIVGRFHDNPALAAASVMLASALLSQAVFVLGGRKPG